MPKIIFEDTSIQAIDVTEGQPLLDGLLERNVNAKMLCGRRGMCATCHVYVVDGEDSLSPPTKREEMALMMLTGAQPNSRLSCQAKVMHDTVKVRMPEGLYVESLSELEALIGQRTEVPVLHPITGETLVPAGKIIIRSIIMKLSDTDFEASSVASGST